VPVSKVRALADRLLTGLLERDSLAAALRLTTSGDFGTFSIVFDGDDNEPVFRVRLASPDELALQVRQGHRWTNTPEGGTPEHLADTLCGPLRFIWFLHAQDAIGG
jgi:hypothetical protein